MYFSYGIHALLNAVCEPEGVGAAVLIRALEPLDGIELMRERRGLVRDEDLCSGPGKLTQALGVGLELNATDLFDGPDPARPAADAAAAARSSSGTRIGITKAADLPWRFCAAGSRHVSRPWPPGARDGAARRLRASARRRRSAAAGRCRRRRRPAPASAAAAGGVGAASCVCCWRRGLRRRGRRRAASAAVAPAPPGVVGGVGRRRRRRRASGGRPFFVAAARRCPARAARPRAASRSRRGDHEVVPDLGREGAARDRLAAEVGRHRLEPCRVADPDGDRSAVGEADEPGVAVVLGRAGLAGGEPADRGALGPVP